MVKRTLAGVVLVLITLAFFLLRTVHYKLFDLYVYVIGIISTYELLKAFKDGVSKTQKVLVFVFTLLLYPVLSFYRNYVIHFVVGYISLTIFVSVLTTKLEEKDGLFKTIFACFYPTLPLSSMILLNINDNGALFLLILVLAISSFTDVFAYLVGSAIKGPKLCEDLSPKKTISGAVGGLVGGILASLITYFALSAFEINVFGMANKLNVIIFLIASGAFLSAVSQVGDLVESYIKRRLNVKDMGKIIPGHGGMLDRVDSLTFTSLFTFIIYSLII